MSRYSKNYAEIDWSKDLGPIGGTRRISRRVNNVISDSLGADLEHHGYADGRRTDSKSVFRRWTKEGGFVEKGNDRDRSGPAKPADIRRDVALAVEMVKNGYKPQIRGE